MGAWGGYSSEVVNPFSEAQHQEKTMKTGLGCGLCAWLLVLLLLALIHPIFLRGSDKWQRITRTGPLLLVGVGVPAFLWGRHLSRREA
jgi:hypothetical protein